MTSHKYMMIRNKDSIHGGFPILNNGKPLPENYIRLGYANNRDEMLQVFNAYNGVKNVSRH